MVTFVCTVKKEHQKYIDTIEHIHHELSYYGQGFAQRGNKPLCSFKRYKELVTTNTRALTQCYSLYKKELQEAGFLLSRGDQFNVLIQPVGEAVIVYNKGDFKTKDSPEELGFINKS